MELLSGIFSSAWAIFLIVLFFGGSIFVHELGHFLAARRRGVKVSRFSIGFGPAIWKRTAQDGVEYRLSWIPLGGYVALPQLADMAAIEGESDVDAATLPPISYSTRMIVFGAGAFFNILFAFALATILWFAGRPEPEHVTSTRIGYVIEKIQLPDKSVVPSPAHVAGLKPGDLIVAIDGKPMRSWLDVLNSIVLSTRVNDAGERLAVFTIEREGRQLDLSLRPVRTGDEKFRKVGIDTAYDVIVEGIKPNTPAAQIGLKPGDQLLTVDGKKIWSLPSLAALLSPTPGTAQSLVVTRNGQPHSLTFTSNGAAAAHPFEGLSITTNWRLLYQNPFAQIQSVLANSIQTLGVLIHPRGDVGLQNVSGFIGIGRGFWDALKSEHPIRFVIWFTVMVNVSLAFFNLLPIPVLDGGHMLFATIGKLRGRALPGNFIAATQSVFMILLLTMIVYVSVFDVRRLVRDVKADNAAKEAVEKERPAEPAK